MGRKQVHTWIVGVVTIIVAIHRDNLGETKADL